MTSLRRYGNIPSTQAPGWASSVGWPARGGSSMSDLAVEILDEGLRAAKPGLRRK